MLLNMLKENVIFQEYYSPYSCYCSVHIYNIGSPHITINAKTVQLQNESSNKFMFHVVQKVSSKESVKQRVLN